MLDISCESYTDHSHRTNTWFYNKATHFASYFKLQFKFLFELDLWEMVHCTYHKETSNH